jgi:hypothetical protein
MFSLVCFNHVYCLLICSLLCLVPFIFLLLILDMHWVCLISSWYLDFTCMFVRMTRNLWPLYYLFWKVYCVLCTRIFFFPYIEKIKTIYVAMYFFFQGVFYSDFCLSKSKLLYDWRSVSQAVCLCIEHPCGTCNQILLPVGILLSAICGLVSDGRPLWREDGSAICSVIT